MSSSQHHSGNHIFKTCNVCNHIFKTCNVFNPCVKLSVCICNFHFRSYPVCGSKHRRI